MEDIQKNDIEERASRKFWVAGEGFNQGKHLSHHATLYLNLYHAACKQAEFWLEMTFIKGRVQKSRF